MIFNAYSGGTEGLFGISLRSAGHIFAQEGRRISRPGGRSDWLLFYVAEGSEDFSLTGEERMQEGSFILFRPFERQEHTHRDTRTGEFYYIHFDAPEGFDPLGLCTSVIYHAPRNTAVRDLFECVIAELQTKQHAYGKLCAAKLLELLALLAREAADSHAQGGRHTGQIAGIVQLFNREYFENHPLEHYAALCHMSKFHFLRVFREVTGSTPVEYKNRIRMEHAEMLLSDLALPIQEIAAQLGYSSPAYFCEAFRKHFGTSPSQYRKNMQGIIRES